MAEGIVGNPFKKVIMEGFISYLSTGVCVSVIVLLYMINKELDNDNDNDLLE